MTTQHPLLNISAHDLKRAVTLRERIEVLQCKLEHTLGGEIPTPSGLSRGKRTMSASARAHIATAQRAHWAIIRGGKGRIGRPPNKPKRKVSASARARISTRLKARWAEVRKAGGKSL